MEIQTDYATSEKRFLFSLFVLPSCIPFMIAWEGWKKWKEKKRPKMLFLFSSPRRTNYRWSSSNFSAASWFGNRRQISIRVGLNVICIPIWLLFKFVLENVWNNGFGILFSMKIFWKLSKLMKILTGAFEAFLWPSFAAVLFFSK